MVVYHPYTQYKNIFRETEKEDLTSVMQKIIRTFPDKLYSYGYISSLYTIKKYIKGDRKRGFN